MTKWRVNGATFTVDCDDVEKAREMAISFIVGKNRWMLESVEQVIETPEPATRKASRYDLSTIMSTAHQLRHNVPGADFGLCLKEAWRLEKIAMLEKEERHLWFADIMQRDELKRYDEIGRKLFELSAA